MAGTNKDAHHLSGDFLWGGAWSVLRQRTHSQADTAAHVTREQSGVVREPSGVARHHPCAVTPEAEEPAALKRSSGVETIRATGFVLSPDHADAGAARPRRRSPVDSITSEFDGEQGFPPEIQERVVAVRAACHRCLDLMQQVSASVPPEPGVEQDTLDPVFEEITALGEVIIGQLCAVSRTTPVGRERDDVLWGMYGGPSGLYALMSTCQTVQMSMTPKWPFTVVAALVSVRGHVASKRAPNEVYTGTPRIEFASGWLGAGTLAGTPDWLFSVRVVEACAAVRDSAASSASRVAAVYYMQHLCWASSETFSRQEWLQQLMLDSDALPAIGQLVSDLFPLPAAGACESIAHREHGLDAHDTLGQIMWSLLFCTNAMHMGDEKEGVSPDLMRHFAQALLENGLLAFCARLVRSCASLTSMADAHPAVCCALCVMVLIVSSNGIEVSSLVDACRLLEVPCCPKAGMHRALSDIADRGVDAAPLNNIYNFVWLHLKAATALALLYGREEEDDQADEPADGSLPLTSSSGDNPALVVTVPARIVAQLVGLVKEMVEGRDAGTVTSAIQPLLALSKSDAHTGALVGGAGGPDAPNVLDVIIRVLSISRAELQSRKHQYRFALPRCREMCAELLLNLILSDVTMKAVAERPEIAEAVAHAMADTNELTARGKQLLDSFIFQVKRQSALGDQCLLGGASCTLDGGGAAPPPKGHSTNDGNRPSKAGKHIMLSYSWAQKSVVNRIRAALGARGYNVWIDTEQMRGSTVEAMAEAIDNSQAVLYGVSEQYKESANCKLEAMYAHQQSVQMLPLMLASDYKANGWLGFLLGTSLWYGFTPDVMDSDDLFTVRHARARSGAGVLPPPHAAAPP